MLKIDKKKKNPSYNRRATFEIFGTYCLTRMVETLWVLHSINRTQLTNIARK